MKNIFFGVVLVLVFGTACQTDQPETVKNLQSFDLEDIKITGGPFYEGQQADLKYILALDVDRLLAPYLKDAGLKPLKDNYGNWENTGLDGHIGGHYLSALSYMYAATGNQECIDRIDYMLDWLDKCQQANGNGYIGGVPDGKKIWEAIRKGDIDAGTFSLNKGWVPLYNIHKIYAGLRDVYLVTHKEKALEMLVKLTDWMADLTKDLTDEQIQEMLISEHGGLNEVFADVAALTGDNKYLELSKRFSHHLILDPLLEGKNELTGLHANTQIPKVIGYKRYADVAHNEEWDKASEFFWNTVINDWTISIGGNSVREHFHPADDFSSMIESNQGPETCNTYNMLRLTKMLFLTDPQLKYIDYYERALYNHILSSEHLQKGGFVYFTPMRPRHYRVYSQPQQGFWCCVGSGLENPGLYGTLAYAKAENEIWVNLFLPSTVEWKEKSVKLTQETKFPYEEKTRLKIETENPQEFTMKIRKPSWIASSFNVLVNGEKQKVTTTNNGYVAIKREWKNDDEVEVDFSMEAKTEYLPDGSAWASIIYGPIVLAAETDTTDLVGLWADDSRMGHVANGPLYPINEAPIIVSDKQNIGDFLIPVEGEPLHFKLDSHLVSDKYNNLVLRPFYEIHEARYMTYWPVVSPDQMKERMAAIKSKEEKLIALEKITVDEIALGEQQPESDHGFKGDGTYTGITESSYWRGASGWFSYELNDKNKEAKTLRVTYHGSDKGHKFNIYVNGVLLQQVSTDGSLGDQLVDVDYPLSDTILKKSSNGKVLVKFEAEKDFFTPRIFHVRLVNE